MRFQLDHDESVADGIRRIGCEVIDSAVDLLVDRTIDAEQRVHDARTAMKRLRSLLRIARRDIGEEVFRRDDDLFRSVARGLAPNRDRAVLIDTIAALRLDEPMVFDEHSFFELWERIADDEGTSLGPDERIVEQSIAMLREGKDRVEQWRVHSHDFRAMQWGIRRVYRRGRRMYAETLGSPSPELLHDWRRQVKYLWYMMSLLTPMWPRIIKALAIEYRLLSVTLGLDHDLILLRSRLSPDSSNFASVIDAIDRRREGLLKSAQRSGGKLFAESSRNHVARLASYWKCWRR